LGIGIVKENWRSYPAGSLFAQTMGIIGAGRIGTEVARIASKGFGMRIAYTDIVRNQKIESLHNASWYPTREEVLKHKWLESEKKGYDIGYSAALIDWILKYRRDWRNHRRK
jgi:hypothetical protein